MEKSSVKRPVTLLCLSDLHLDSNHGKVVLEKLRSAVVHLEDKEENIQWRPDFIVLAGDLVDARKRDKNKEYYENLQKYLDTFIKDSRFQLTPFKVIAVPGNHDKKIPCWKDFCYESDSRCTVCKELENAQKLKEENEKDGEFNGDFIKTYNRHFKQFGEFYSRFCSKRTKEETYFFPEVASNKNLTSVALTSGLKIFDEYKICFLCINTEWTYFPDKERRFDEGFLWSQFVHSSLEHFIQEYNGYTLVTVMHRNPTELSWKTKFRTKPTKPNILRNLYQYSDIILTGHNHTERLLPPDRMENHAQLFQLGPVSMSPRGATLPLYHASLIHINPLEGFVKVCNFRYNHDEHKWEHEIDSNDYSITPYPVILPPETKPSVAELTVIPLKGFNDNGIVKALKGHFPNLTKEYSFFYKNIQEGRQALCNWMNQKRKDNSKKNIAFFVYCGLPNLEDEVRKEFDGLKQDLLFNDDFKYALYRKEVILIEVWFRHRDPLEIRTPRVKGK